MFDDDDPFCIEQLGEFALWLLRWAATCLLVGIFAEVLIASIP